MAVRLLHIACGLGIVSKRADAAYAPGNRGLWLKGRCRIRNPPWRTRLVLAHDVGAADLPWRDCWSK
jgi:ATP-dependent DNA ligase